MLWKDYCAKLDFCQLMKWKIENSNYILDRLTFSDEATFHLSDSIIYHVLVAVFSVQNRLRKFGNTRILKS